MAKAEVKTNSGKPVLVALSMDIRDAAGTLRDRQQLEHILVNLKKRSLDLIYSSE